MGLGGPVGGLVSDLYVNLPQRCLPAPRSLDVQIWVAMGIYHPNATLCCVAYLDTIQSALRNTGKLTSP